MTDRTRAGLTLATAFVAVFTILTLWSSPVSAHTPSYSATCNGARLRGVGYEDQHTNSAYITIDGHEVFSTADFGTDLDVTRPIPQDGQVHAVAFFIDAQGAGTLPQFDLDVTVQVGPCGESTTSTTELETTSTTEPEETTPTTEPEETTSTVSPPTSTTTNPTTTTTGPIGSQPETDSTSPQPPPPNNPPQPPSSNVGMLPETGPTGPQWAMIAAASILVTTGVAAMVVVRTPKDGKRR
jgi:hypothetical protein